MPGRLLLTMAFVSLLGTWGTTVAAASPAPEGTAGTRSSGNDLARAWVVTNPVAPFTATSPLPTPGRNPTVPQAVVADGDGVLQSYVGRPSSVFVNRWTAARGWTPAVRVAADATPWSVTAASAGRLALVVWTTSALPTTVRVSVRSASGRWGTAATLPCRPGAAGVTALASRSAVAVGGCSTGRWGWLRSDRGSWTEIPSVPMSSVLLAGAALAAVDATAADGSVVGRAWSHDGGWTSSLLQAAASGRTVAVTAATDGRGAVAAWTTRDCAACAGSRDQPRVDVSSASWRPLSGWSVVTTLWSGRPTPDRPDGTTVGEISLAAAGSRAVVAFDVHDRAGWTRPDTLLAAVRGADGAWRGPRVLAAGHGATWPATAFAGDRPWVGWVRTAAPAAASPWLRPGVDARVVALGADGAPLPSRVVSGSPPSAGDRMALAGTPAGLVATWGRQANLWRAASRQFAVPTVVLPRGTSADVPRAVVAAGAGALLVLQPTVAGDRPTVATASFLPPTVLVQPTIRRSPASFRCVPPTVSPTPRIMTVRWTRDGRVIAGERAFAHARAAADRGALMRCVVGISTPASPSIVVSSSAVRG